MASFDETHSEARRKSEFQIKLMERDPSEPKVVLIAAKNSQHCEYSFKWYFDNIHRKGNQVVIVYIIELPEQRTSSSRNMHVSPKTLQELWQKEEERTLEIEDTMRRLLQEKKCSGVLRTAAGRPGATICKVAHEESASMVIIGARCEHKMKDLFVSSIPEYVIQHAPCPVVINHLQPIQRRASSSDIDVRTRHFSDSTLATNKSRKKKLSFIDRVRYKSARDKSSTDEFSRSLAKIYECFAVMSNLQKHLQTKLLPSKGLSKPPGGRRGPMKRDYTPSKWNDYFDRKEDVSVGDDVFRIYLAGSEGPACVFLHGGGYSGLSWAVLTKDLISSVRCRVVAIDLRGHGDSKAEDEDDLSAETLSRDVGNVLNAFYKDEIPPIVLIGHSMGGAIAVHAAVNNHIPNLVGLCVIDVVEGTAMDALSHMQGVLRGRPKTFKSLEYAIEWCVRTGQVRNVESAKVSMVGQVLRADTHETATEELEHSSDVIQEEPINEIQQEETEATSQTHHYIWRIDLSKSEKFWKGWFEGLSQKFLSVSVPKVLLLANTDRLDRDLTLGQMQGKFQMQVLMHCGHVIHEDNPDKVAETLAAFLTRHKFC
ncbi:DgyrCDS1374 [Dimorphilus gyrociliatus]|uniref:protein phosphatase methylesterase-1 n=1 Tax=Dimorphilus gyrociliatus TaxID=2664684 RepID=A0A7I8V8Y1_9ANNE|nr:DgyrCDS1374 [Dimorphilus gyrociliatus]